MRGQAPDAAIAALARRQYGVVARRQLLALGIHPKRIDRAVAAGRLHPLHRGVYAVGHHAPRREASWLAAVLACAPGAVLSHHSAAALWGLREPDARRPHVTLAHHARPRGVVAHTARLGPLDATTRHGIPVTSVARTLVDLAHAVPGRELERALREAAFRRLAARPALEDALARRPARPLRLLLDDLAGTQSGLEDALLRLCAAHRLPRPLTQQRVRGRRVDFLWPRERVVVETDGWQAHATPDAFQRDRTTTNALLLADVTVLRFTHADLTRRPAATARQLRAALARGARRSGA